MSERTSIKGDVVPANQIPYTSMNGKSTDVAILPAGTCRICPQAVFDTADHSGYFMWFAVSASDTVGGTTPADFNPILRLGADGNAWVQVDETASLYLHILITDAAQAAQNGGASDGYMVVVETMP